MGYRPLKTGTVAGAITGLGTRIIITTNIALLAIKSIAYSIFERASYYLETATTPSNP